MFVRGKHRQNWKWIPSYLVSSWAKVTRHCGAIRTSFQNVQISKWRPRVLLMPVPDVWAECLPGGWPGLATWHITHHTLVTTLLDSWHQGRDTRDTSSSLTPQPRPLVANCRKQDENCVTLCHKTCVTPLLEPHWEMTADRITREEDRLPSQSPIFSFLHRLVF